ncbi:hypothetical protein ACGGAQ_15190 [Micromonospora sp. NPDC047557]|uniref:hypothetical protein n=1 Tax=Micromonospora sp. NPDC047557 TaxID=3364250 RepID=UPI0037136BF6
MTGAETRHRPHPLAPGGAMRAALRLARLHLASRRVPAALAAVAACAIGLRVALRWQWDAYGALQLPLIFETGCAVAIVVTATSLLGEPERVTGRWLPFLRLATTLALTVAAVGALAAAGAGAHLAGGTIEVLRNLVGLVGIGLLCAALLGGAQAWAGPTTYLMIALYGLYTQWHGPALTTPWLWPARPPHDLGGALCAGVVFVAGVLLVAVRGARDTGPETARSG